VRAPHHEDTLLARVERRREELEAAIVTRIRSDGAPTESDDPEYAEGLRGAIPIAVDYCIAAIERPEANPPPIPAALRAQARVAARNEIPLDTVLRRYFAGYTLLGDLLIEELETAGVRRGADLQRLLRLLAASFDRLLAAISEEYREEEHSRSRSSEQRRAELIQRMLAGEPLNPPGLGYDFGGHHLAVVTKGPGASVALRELAGSLDRRLLLLEREEGMIWAWMGGKRPPDLEALRRLLVTKWPAEARLAIGEPGQGLGGWRLSHQQARAALAVVIRSNENYVRYGDVALLAGVFGDELLATSLREMYLAPLREQRGRGEVLLETLRAYFAADRNVSSAASALGVNRETVRNRLDLIETRLDRTLSSCVAEIETALRLEGFAIGQSDGMS
jgi:hypothetical protein